MIRFVFESWIKIFISTKNKYYVTLYCISLYLPTGYRRPIPPHLPQKHAVPQKKFRIYPLTESPIPPRSRYPCHRIALVSSKPSDKCISGGIPVNSIRVGVDVDVVWGPYRPTVRSPSITLYGCMTTTFWVKEKHILPTEAFPSPTDTLFKVQFIIFRGLDANFRASFHQHLGTPRQTKFLWTERGQERMLSPFTSSRLVLQLDTSGYQWHVSPWQHTLLCRP